MKYKHALFLNPYIESASTSTMGLFPPTGVEYVATSAKNFVEKLTLLDLRYEKELSHTNNLLEFIHDEKVDIICVGIGWDRQFNEICTLINRMPEHIPLVVGGYKATERVEDIFKTCPKVNIIVRGEGEETIQDIMKDVELESILGISYRVDSKVIHNKHRSLSRIDFIESPDRTLRRNSYYMSLQGIKVTRITFDAVLGARGCPYNCKFCTFSLNPLGQKRNYTTRSVESVIKEIENIDANMVLFSDDNFSANIKRAEEICDKIIERKIKKRFMAQARIEIARSPSLLDKMVKAGFKMLSLGIESPHDHILAELNKGFDSEGIRKAFKVLKKYPIFYHGYFIYGNIGETEKEMLYIAQFSKEIDVDTIAFSKLRMDKFSPLKKIAESTPGYHVTDNGAVYSDKYTHPVLKKIGRKIKFSFYTPFRILKIAKRFLVVKFFTFGDIISFIIASPLLLVRIIRREIVKKRLGDSIKQIFTRNVKASQ